MSRELDGQHRAVGTPAQPVAIVVDVCDLESADPTAVETGSHFHFDARSNGFTTGLKSRHSDLLIDELAVPPELEAP